MRSSCAVILLLQVLAVGCTPTPARLTPLKVSDETQRSEVIVYRESAFNWATRKLVFGADGEDYVTLRNADYAQLYLSPKMYQFFVRSEYADRPYVLTATLNANDRKCMKAYANPANWGTLPQVVDFVLPLPLVGTWVTFAGNRFLLEEVTCPSPEDLAKYSKVEVQYREK